jgi:hypothetical protein
MTDASANLTRVEIHDDTSKDRTYTYFFKLVLNNIFEDYEYYLLPDIAKITAVVTGFGKDFDFTTEHFDVKYSEYATGTTIIYLTTNRFITSCHLRILKTSDGTVSMVEADVNGLNSGS